MMDRQGTIEPLKLPARSYAFPRISSDGKRVAFEIDEGKQSEVWIYELAKKTAARQLTIGGSNRYPVWSPDGTRIAFQSDREGDPAIFWQWADGGSAKRLTKPEQGVVHIPDSWSRDGNSLSFTAVKGAEAAVWILSVRDGTSTVFAQAPSAFIARSAFSPDGHWLAYQSNEETGTNRYRIWVQSFPTGARQLIVAGGQPFWSLDGSELFYNAGSGGLVSKVTVFSTKANFAFSDPIPVAQGQLVNASSSRLPRNADITPEGKLLGLIDAETSQSGSPVLPQIQIVLNWFQELKQRAPVK
jgi:serine/threonine-protein kinase